MGRASDIFRKIMLGILLLIMSTALLLTAVNGLARRHYLDALLAGAVWAFILYRLCTRGKLGTLASIDTRKTTLLLTLLCAAVNLGGCSLCVWSRSAIMKRIGRQPARWLPAERSTPRGTLPCTRILGCSTFLSAFLKIFGEHVVVAAVINVILTCLSGLLIQHMPAPCVTADGGAGTSAVDSLPWRRCF